jgi:integrase
MEFCQQVQKRPTPNAALFARSVLFMCRHGLRPEEFARKRFGVDPETGHLRIRGTKNANAERVVPYIFDFGTDDPPKIDTLNRMFERMATKVRCRDFRRTFASWCQEARIPNNRIQAYMGHGAQTVTQTYQQVVPTAKMLDQDRRTLDAWVNAELRKSPSRRDESVPLSAFRAMQQMLSPSLGQMRERIGKEAAADAATSVMRKKGTTSRD